MSMRKNHCVSRWQQVTASYERRSERDTSLYSLGRMIGLISRKLRIAAYASLILASG